MAQRYLLALDYSDAHARYILMKHMKKRSLGNIEAKYNYTLLEPTVSFRTVKVDVGASRSMRPRSTNDIIEEQHRVIHSLGHRKKTRSAASSPSQKRVQPSLQDSHEVSSYKLKKFRRVPLVNIQRSASPSLGKNALNVRPKSSAISVTTPRGGQETLRPATTSPQLEYLSYQDPLDKITREERQLKRQLTQRLKDHWNSDNKDVSYGVYARRQNLEMPGSESWLVFGGGQHESAEGIVNAFTVLNNADEFYNIDGGVGCRVAQQLHKGDKIRIGINGVVQSHYHKEPPKEEETENHQEEDLDALQKKLDKLMQETSDAETTSWKPAITQQPLSWEQQLKDKDAKILTSRQPQLPRPAEKKNESHPVIFEKTKRTLQAQPKLPADHLQGFRIQSRNKPANRSTAWGDDNQKVSVVSIDNRTKQEEDALAVLSVDEVIRAALKSAQSCRTESSSPELVMNGQLDSASGKKFNSSLFDHWSPHGFPDHTVKLVKPSVPSISNTHQVDLSILGPGSTLDKANMDARKKHTSPKSARYPPRLGAVSTLGQESPLDAAFIKIAVPIIKPDDKSHSNANYFSVSEKSSIRLILDRESVNQAMKERTEMEFDAYGGKPPSPASCYSEVLDCGPTPLQTSNSCSPKLQLMPLSAASSLLISIPTAEDMCEQDSQSQSLLWEAEEISSPQKREKELQDAHVRDLTSILSAGIDCTQVAE